MPLLVGLKEFAEVIGWERARLSVKYTRQQEGKKVRPPIPEPVQMLAATPLWTLKQAEAYKKLLNKDNKANDKDGDDG
ncbi:hypothetical protein D7X33_17715 [Butyricicoccus sp. 1XD8-22]|nr:hypothetical protein D7X33_17715 [Butyricicoccus sp. 1XD8-22]